MYEGETEPIPRATDRNEPDKPDMPGRDEHDQGHHHHHDHRPPPPASRRVRTMVAALLVPFALAALVGTVLLFPFGDGPKVQGGAGRPVDGVVTAAESGACNGGVQVGEQPDEPQCLLVTVRMTDGEAPGEEVRTVVPLEPSTPRFAVDDEVVLSYGGSDPRDGGSYQLVDFQRDMPLALLAGLFAVAVLVLGRWQGLKALVALGLSFLVLVFFVLPAIIAGENPLLVAICGAGVIMFAVLYLTHGLSARTSTAVLGTMVSLAMIGVLGALWAAFARLTGLDEDTSTLVGLLNAPIDTRGLLLAGVVIGALGVLDDVTVTQTSAVWELRVANPLLTRRELYTSALRIGRDHVASAVNTLVMAYAGAALPLLLYSSISGVGLGSILTSQSIAQELVRTLVGSIGLVAAVPITTALAAAVATQEPAPERAGTRAGRGRTGTRAAGKRAEEHPEPERQEHEEPTDERGRRAGTGRRTADGPGERTRRTGPGRADPSDRSGSDRSGSNRRGEGTRRRTAVRPGASAARRSRPQEPPDDDPQATDRPVRRARRDAEDPSGDRPRERSGSDADSAAEWPSDGTVRSATRRGRGADPDGGASAEWAPDEPSWPAQPTESPRSRPTDSATPEGWALEEPPWPAHPATPPQGRQADTETPQNWALDERAWPSHPTASPGNRQADSETAAERAIDERSSPSHPTTPPPDRRTGTEPSGGSVPDELFRPSEPATTARGRQADNETPQHWALDEPPWSAHPTTPPRNRPTDHEAAAERESERSSWPSHPAAPPRNRRADTENETPAGWPPEELSWPSPSAPPRGGRRAAPDHESPGRPTPPGTTWPPAAPGFAQPRGPYDDDRSGDRARDETAWAPGPAGPARAGGRRSAADGGDGDGDGDGFGDGFGGSAPHPEPFPADPGDHAPPRHRRAAAHPPAEQELWPTEPDDQTQPPSRPSPRQPARGGDSPTNGRHGRSTWFQDDDQD